MNSSAPSSAIEPPGSSPKARVSFDAFNSKKKQGSSQNAPTGADPSRLYDAYETTKEERTDSAAILRWD
jgi:hypothetical protein